MKSGKISRRDAVGTLGALGAAAGSVALTTSRARAAGLPQGTSSASDNSVESNDPGCKSRDVSKRLLAPLEAGSSFAGWTVERVTDLEEGAVSVVCVDGTGASFQLDVCRRDPAAAIAAPGQSEHFDVVLANHGSGSEATFENHGLAAMALAEIIRGNEQHVNLSEFATLTERSVSARTHV